MGGFSNIKLIGLDLDGTVIGTDNRIPAANLEAIRACHSAGIELAFLTGRRPLTARPHLETIGLPCQLATNSGCLLWEFPSWEQTGARFFPPELLEPVAELIYPRSANFHVDASATGFEFFHLERQSNPALEEYMRRYGANTRSIIHASEMLGCNVTQLAMPSDDAEVIARFADEINQSYSGRLLALGVRWPLMDVLALEVFHVDANKGRALEFCAARRGIAQEQCLAVGDDVNDLAMIEWAGYGAAMPHAPRQVLAAASEVLAGAGAQALAGFLFGLLES